jgi:hypothetical protein
LQFRYITHSPGTGAHSPGTGLTVQVQGSTKQYWYRAHRSGTGGSQSRYRLTVQELGLKVQILGSTKQSRYMVCSSGTDSQSSDRGSQSRYRAHSPGIGLTVLAFPLYRIAKTTLCVH